MSLSTHGRLRRTRMLPCGHISAQSKAERAPTLPRVFACGVASASREQAIVCPITAALLRLHGMAELRPPTELELVAGQRGTDVLQDES